MASETCPLSNIAGRLAPEESAELPAEATALVACEHRHPFVVGDAEIHTDAASGGAIDLGNGDAKHDLLFARNPEQVDHVAIRVSQEEVFQTLPRRLAGLGELTRRGNDIDIPNRDLLILVSVAAAIAAWGVGGDNSQDLSCLHHIFGLASEHQFVADQREPHDAVGECMVDLPFQRLVDPLQAFLLLGIGQHANQIAEHPRGAPFCGSANQRFSTVSPMVLPSTDTSVSAMSV